ncbi:MAG TPA: ester cyclase [Streptosporangiaceae bacterium]|nr:ester cyclase [Streptosporangiaceae bacterium]
MSGDGDLVTQMMTAMLSNDPDVVLEMYADDCRVSDPAMQASGKAGLRRAVEYFFAAFRMQEIEVDEVIRQAPTLIIRSRWQALHQGEYLGVQPTGRLFATWNIMWLVVRDGKIISDTSVWDAGELRRLEQLPEATRTRS